MTKAPAFLTGGLHPDASTSCIYSPPARFWRTGDCFATLPRKSRSRRRQSTRPPRRRRYVTQASRLPRVPGLSDANRRRGRSEARNDGISRDSRIPKSRRRGTATISNPGPDVVSHVFGLEMVSEPVPATDCFQPLNARHCAATRAVMPFQGVLL